MFGARLLAIHGLEHAFNANGAAALTAFKGLRVGQPHEAAASRTWHELVGADGGNAYCLDFPAGPKSGA